MRKRFRGKMYNRIVAAVLTVGILTGICTYGVRAYMDESMYVHVSASEVPVSTMVVGTHLIAVDAMSDQLYAIAEASALESGQTTRYYKSELSGKKWYEISAAETVTAINGEKQETDDSVIDALWFGYQTKSDHLTYNLKTGAVICIFNIIKPYDLINLPDLSGIRTQYDALLTGSDLTDSQKYAKEVIQTYMNSEVENEKTAIYDAQLEVMQNYYQNLSAQGETQYLQILLDAMEVVDASRRAEVYRILNERVLPDLREIMDGTMTFQGQPSDYEPEPDLVAAIATAEQSVAESMLSYENQTTGAQDTVAGSVQSRLIEELVGKAGAGSYSDAEELLKQLNDLTALNSGLVEDGEGERSLLEETMLPEAENQFYSGVEAGVSGEYIAATSDLNTVYASLENMLKTQKNTLSRMRTELQFLVKSYVTRITDEEEKEVWIRKRIDALTTVYDKIPSDAFESFAIGELDTYGKWLENLIAEVVTASGGSELEALTAEKEAVLKKQQEALDSNDLKAAEAYDSVLAGLQDKIDKFGGGSTKTIESLQKDCMKNIRKTDFDSALQNLESIGGFVEANRIDVLSAMNAIYETVSGYYYLTDEEDDKYGSLESIMKWITDFIAGHADALSGVLTTDKIYDYFAEQFGVDVTEADALSQAKAITALSRYADHTQDKDVKAMVQLLAETFTDDGNRYFFMQYEEAATEYVSAQAIAACLDYRYVFENVGRNGLLSSKGSYYKFKVFDTQVDRSNGSVDTMDYPAGYAGGLYICEAYALEQFGCQTEYITGSDYAVLLMKDMSEEADTMFDDLVEKGNQ